MKYIAHALFAAGLAVVAFGVFKNFSIDGRLGGIGTMSMNSFYLLSISIFAASAAAQLIWGERR